MGIFKDLSRDTIKRVQEECWLTEPEMSGIQVLLGTPIAPHKFDLNGKKKDMTTAHKKGGTTSEVGEVAI